VLVARKASALGATSTGTVVSDGASLRLDGNVTTAAEPLTINGQGVGGTNGALSNVSGTNTYAGPITLGSPARIGALAGTLVVSGNIDTTANGHTLTIDTGATVDITGIISGAGILNKQGVGTLILRGANTYTGETDARNGVLQLRSNSALGATSAETVTFGQGTVQTFTSGILVGGLTIAEPIRINGGGFSSRGALQNGGGTNTWTGTVGVPNPASVGSAAGTLIISGVISGDQPLTKFGAGGVALAGNNAAYTGHIRGAGGNAERTIRHRPGRHRPDRGHHRQFRRRPGAGQLRVQRHLRRHHHRRDAALGRRRHAARFQLPWRRRQHLDRTRHRRRDDSSHNRHAVASHDQRRHLRHGADHQDRHVVADAVGHQFADRDHHRQRGDTARERHRAGGRGCRNGWPGGGARRHRNRRPRQCRTAPASSIPASAGLGCSTSMAISPSSRLRRCACRSTAPDAAPNSTRWRSPTAT
jgi:autotransporter-associated beta strand protein